MDYQLIGGFRRRLLVRSVEKRSPVRPFMAGFACGIVFVLLAALV